MNSSQKTILATLVVVALGSFAIWDGSRKEQSEKKADEAKLIVPFETADIAALEFSNNQGQRIVLERIVKSASTEANSKNSNEKAAPPVPQSADIGQWKMVAPLADSADSLTIESVLSTLKTEKSREVVAQGKEVNWAIFGLDHPVTTLKVTVHGKSAAANPARTDKTPEKTPEKTPDTMTETIEIGGVKAYDSSLYARIDHGDKVVLVSSIWDVILSKLPREYRDKRLVRDHEGSDFSKIEFTESGDKLHPASHLSLTQKNHKWFLDDGVAADSLEPISEIAVINYLSQIMAARANEFVLDDKTASGALKSNGLMPPLSQVKLYTAEKTSENPSEKTSPLKLAVELAFAAVQKDKPNVAAISSDFRPIVRVFSSFVEGLHKPAKAFFDKLAPFQFKVAEVAKMQIQTKGSLAEEPLDIELEKRGNDWVVATKGLQKQIDNSKLKDMIQRISELEAVRFVQPISTVPTAHELLPKKIKTTAPAGQNLNQNLSQMSNRITLKRADNSLVFELRWGDLLFEKSDVSGLSPEDAKLPGQVEAQFVATETSQSKWLMGVPEGSMKDLGIHVAIADHQAQTKPQADTKANGAHPGNSGTAATPTPLPTPMANFEPVKSSK